MSSFSLKPGDILKERYLVKEPLARGGIGETFLAEDNRSKKEIVLKVLPFSSLKDWKELELFEREIDVLKNLNYPNIPRYIDHFKIDSEREALFVLAQEYVRGKNLKDLAKSGKRFTIAEIESILRELLEILQYIHHLNPPVIHRDVNPNNIILDENGKIYLVDFGAVGKLSSSTLAASGTFVGTIGYMPQEQLYGKSLPASDIYGAGMSIIFLLTGKNPSDFEFDGKKLNYHDFVNIPDRLKILLDKMTVPDYKTRLSEAGKGLDYLKGKENVFETAFTPVQRNNIHVSALGDGSKEIKFKGAKLVHIFLLFFSIAWNSLVFPMSIFWMKGVSFLFVLFFLPFYAVGIGLLTFALFGFFGKTSILLMSDKIIFRRQLFGIKITNKEMRYINYHHTEIDFQEGNKGSKSYFLRVLGREKELKISNYSASSHSDVKFINDIIINHISGILQT